MPVRLLQCHSNMDRGISFHRSSVLGVWNLRGRQPLPQDSVIVRYDSSTVLVTSDISLAVCIRWTGLGTGLGTGLWDWTHRKLRSSFLKARKQEIADRHYIAATVDNSLPSTRGVPTQLSPCRQPAVVLPCKTSRSTSFRCEFVHDLTTTSRNTWQSLLSKFSYQVVQPFCSFLNCILLPSWHFRSCFPPACAVGL